MIDPHELIDSSLFFTHGIISTPRLQIMIEDAKKNIEAKIPDEENFPLLALADVFYAYANWLLDGNAFSTQTAHVIQQLASEPYEHFAALPFFDDVKHSAQITINMTKDREEYYAERLTSAQQREEQLALNLAAVEESKQTAVRSLIVSQKSLVELKATLEETQRTSQETIDALRQELNAAKAQISSLTAENLEINHKMEGRERVHQLFLQAAAQDEKKILAEKQAMEENYKAQLTQAREALPAQNRALKSENEALQKKLDAALKANATEKDNAIILAQQRDAALIEAKGLQAGNATLFKKQQESQKKIDALEQAIQTLKQPAPIKEKEKKQEAPLVEILRPAPTETPLNTRTTNPQPTLKTTPIAMPQKPANEAGYAAAMHIDKLFKNPHAVIPAFEIAYPGYKECIASKKQNEEIEEIFKLLPKNMSIEEAKNITLLIQDTCKLLTSDPATQVRGLFPFLYKIDGMLDARETFHRNHASASARLNVYISTLEVFYQIASLAAFKDSPAINNAKNLAEQFCKILTNDDKTETNDRNEITKKLDTMSDIYYLLADHQALLLKTRDEFRLTSQNQTMSLPSHKIALTMAQLAFYKLLLSKQAASKLNEMQFLDLLNEAINRFTQKLSLNGISITNREITDLLSTFPVRAVFNTIDEIWTPIIQTYFSQIEINAGKKDSKYLDNFTDATISNIFVKLIAAFPSLSKDEILAYHFASCARWSPNSRNKNINTNHRLMTRADAVLANVFAAAEKESHALIPRALTIYIINIIQFANIGDQSICNAPQFEAQYAQLREAATNPLYAIQVPENVLKHFPDKLNMKAAVPLSVDYIRCIDGFQKMIDFKDIGELLQRFILLFDNTPINAKPTDKESAESRLRAITALLINLSEFLTDRSVIAYLPHPKDEALRDVALRVVKLLNDKSFIETLLAKMHRVGGLVRFLHKHSAILFAARDSLRDTRMFYYREEQMQFYASLVAHITETKLDDLGELQQAQLHFVASFALQNGGSTQLMMSLSEIKAVLGAMQNGHMQFIEKVPPGEIQTYVVMDERFKSARENLQKLLIQNLKVSEHEQAAPLLQTSLDKLHKAMVLFVIKFIMQLPTLRKSENKILTFSNAAPEMISSLDRITSPKEAEAVEALAELLPRPKNLEEANIFTFYYVQALDSLIGLRERDPAIPHARVVECLNEMDNKSEANPENAVYQSAAANRFNHIRKRYKTINDFLHSPHLQTLCTDISPELVEAAEKMVAELYDKKTMPDKLKSFVNIGDTHRFLVNHLDQLLEGKAQLEAKKPFTQEVMSFYQDYLGMIQSFRADDPDGKAAVELITTYLFDDLALLASTVDNTKPVIINFTRQDWDVLQDALSVAYTTRKPAPASSSTSKPVKKFTLSGDLKLEFSLGSSNSGTKVTFTPSKGKASTKAQAYAPTPPAASSSRK